MTRLIKLSHQIPYTVNKKRVIRIMKDHSIKADYRQPTHKRIQAQQTYEAENILNDNLTKPQLTKFGLRIRRN